jgi:hypothetical protein
VCRAAADRCDVAEYCTASAAACPADARAPTCTHTVAGGLTTVGGALLPAGPRYRVLNHGFERLPRLCHARGSCVTGGIVP